MIQSAQLFGHYRAGAILFLDKGYLIPLAFM